MQCKDVDACTAFSFKESQRKCALQTSGSGLELSVHVVASPNFVHYIEDLACTTTSTATTTTEPDCVEVGFPCSFSATDPNIASNGLCCDDYTCQEGLFGGEPSCLPFLSIIEGQYEDTTVETTPPSADGILATTAVPINDVPVTAVTTSTEFIATTTITIQCTALGGSCVDTRVGNSASKCCGGLFCAPDESTLQPVCQIQRDGILSSFDGADPELQPDDTTPEALATTTTVTTTTTTTTTTTVTNTTTTTLPLTVCGRKLKQKAYCDSNVDDLGSILLGSAPSRNQDCRAWCESFEESVGCCSMYHMTSNVAQCTAYPVGSRLISASWAPYNYAEACGVASAELRASENLIDVASASSQSAAESNDAASDRATVVGNYIFPIILAACAGTLLIGLVVKVRQRRREEAAAKRQSTSPTFSVDSLDTTAGGRDVSFFGGHGNRNGLLSVSPVYGSPEAPSVTPTRSARSFELRGSEEPPMLSPVVPSAKIIPSPTPAGKRAVHRRKLIAADICTPYKPRSNAVRMRLLGNKILTPNSEFLRTVAVLQGGEAEEVANAAAAASTPGLSPSAPIRLESGGMLTPFSKAYASPSSRSTTSSPAAAFEYDAGDWDDAGTPRPIPRPQQEPPGSVGSSPSGPGLRGLRGAWSTPLHRAPVARRSVPVLTPNSRYLKQLTRLHQVPTTPLPSPAAAARPVYTPNSRYLKELTRLQQVSQPVSTTSLPSPARSLRNGSRLATSSMLATPTTSRYPASRWQVPGQIATPNIATINEFGF